VSAVKGPGRTTRPAAPFQFPTSLRDEWLSIGLSTQPVDRATAEASITELYRLIREPCPSFQWVPSPAAAIEITRGSPDTFPVIRPRSAGTGCGRYGGRLVAAALATLHSDLRSRLDRRIERRPFDSHWLRPRTADALMFTPEDALLSGIGPEDVLEAAVYRSLRGTLRDAIAVPLRTALATALGDADNRDNEATGFCWWGQQDAYWVAHYDIWQRSGLARYRPSDQRELDLWAALARSAGWWWPGRGLCVLSERPVTLHAEPAPGSHHGVLRLHRADGPALVFGDGFGICVVHGTPVPEWVISRPTVDLIRREPNVEVRRTAIERLGWDAYIRQAGLSLVASRPDPGNPGAALSLYDDPADGRVLLVTNGTPEPDGHRRRYGINVPAIFDDPAEAAGWTYGLTGGQYALLARRT
jgi:hypothetical protein